MAGRFGRWLVGEFRLRAEEVEARTGHAKESQDFAVVHIAWVSLVDLGVKALQAFGERFDFLFARAEEFVSQGFCFDGGECLDFGLMLLAPTQSGVPVDVQVGGDLGVGDVARPEFDELVDEVLGMHC